MFLAPVAATRTRAFAESVGCIARKSILPLLLACWLPWIAAAAVPTDERDLASRLAEAQALFENGRTKAALAEATGVLEAAHSSGDVAIELGAQRLTAEIHYWVSDPQTAEKLYRDLLARPPSVSILSTEARMQIALRLAALRVREVGRLVQIVRADEDYIAIFDDKVVTSQGDDTPAVHRQQFKDAAEAADQEVTRLLAAIKPSMHGYAGFRAYADSLKGQLSVMRQDLAGADRLLRKYAASGTNPQPEDAEGLIEALVVLGATANAREDPKFAVKVGELALQHSIKAFGPRAAPTQYVRSWLGAFYFEAKQFEASIESGTEWLAYLRDGPDAEALQSEILEVARRAYAMKNTQLAARLLQEYFEVLLLEQRNNAQAVLSAIRGLDWELEDANEAIANALFEVVIRKPRIETTAPLYLQLLDWTAAYLQLAKRPLEARAVRHRRQALPNGSEASAAAKEMISEASTKTPSRELADALSKAASEASYTDKDFVSSLALYRAAVDTSFRAYGTESSNSVLQVVNTAGTMMDLGRRDEAVEYCWRYVERLRQPNMRDRREARASLSFIAGYLDQLSEHLLADDARRAASTEKTSGPNTPGARLRLPEERDVQSALRQAAAESPYGAEVTEEKLLSIGSSRLAGGQAREAVAALATLLSRDRLSDKGNAIAAHAWLGYAYENDRPEMSAYHLIKYIEESPGLPEESRRVGEVLQNVSARILASREVSTALTRLAQATVSVAGQDVERICSTFDAILRSYEPTDEALGYVAAESEKLWMLAEKSATQDPVRALATGMCTVRVRRALGADESADDLILTLAERFAKAQNSGAAREIASLAAQIGENIRKVGAAREAVRIAKSKSGPPEKLSAAMMNLAEAYNDAHRYQLSASARIEAAHLPRMLFNMEREPGAMEVSSDLFAATASFGFCNALSIENPLATSITSCSVALRNVRLAAVQALMREADAPQPILRGGESEDLQRGNQIRNALNDLLRAEVALNALPIRHREKGLWETFALVEAVRDDESSRATMAVAQREVSSGDVRPTQDGLQRRYWQRVKLARAIGDAAVDVSTAERDIGIEQAARSSDGTSFSIWRPSSDELKSIALGLREGEAAVAYYVAEQEVFVWTIRHDGLALEQSPYRLDDLRMDIRSLLAALDPAASKQAGSAAAAVPVRQAWKLFAGLLQIAFPNDDLPHTIFVVPDGPVNSVPFPALVTAPPVEEAWAPRATWTPNWLVFRSAAVVTPSFSAIRVLRQTKKHVGLQTPFLAFGAPSVGASPRGAPVDWRAILRNGIVSSAEFAKLSALPDAAKEIDDMAALFNAPPEAAVSGPRMTEAALMERIAAQSPRVIAFATHGLPRNVSDDLSEAALVFSRSPSSRSLTEGLLTESEIAALRLDADVVVLSACSTAMAALPFQDDSFAGLPAAFLYAGARSVLVTRWPVVSELAPEITLETLRGFNANPGAGLADALRAAQVKSAGSPVGEAVRHPASWAAFSLVGDSL